MKIGFIQFDVCHDPEKNMAVIESMLSSIKAELIVFPELCTTGYLFETKESLLAQACQVPESPLIEKWLLLSRVYHCSFVFGTAEKEGNHLYNTAVVVSKGKYIGKYRKIHLSDFEKNFFERGLENKVFEIDGVKIGVEICFDLWFPEIAREQICQGAQLLCAPANFGAPATYHLSQTRSVENLTPLILCNRIGHEEIPGMDADFLGKSSITDHRGERIETAPAGFEQASAVELALNVPRQNVICRNFNEEISFHHPNARF